MFTNTRGNYIIVFLAFILISGLMVWQINHLQQKQKLESELDFQDKKATLLNSAIEYRKAESKDSSLRTNWTLKHQKVKDILYNNFKIDDDSLIWAFYNGNNVLIDSINSNSQNEILKNSPLRVCTSCLIMISVLNDDGTNPNDRGFVLDQTPAQMREVRGLEPESLEYLVVYTKPYKAKMMSFVLPSLFLIGLVSLFWWLYHLITKQKRLISQKNEFVNHLSHQFQTPLSSIKLSSNLLASKKSENPDELIQIIQRESNRLENHIKTVLHWVKSDANRLYLKKEYIGITDVIERSLKQMKPVFYTNNTKVSFIPPKEELFIDVDESHLQLMLFNIWENAIKHNNESIAIKVLCKSDDKHITICNTDNGVGFSETSNDIHYKGLGLAYIKRIMELHKGTLEIKSETKKGVIINLNFLKDG